MGKSAVAAAGFMIIPRHILGGRGHPAPSDTLNIGCVGVGGQGSSDIRSVSSENIVALCDVDDEMIAKFLKSERNDPEKQPMYDKAHRYRDFRVMLEKEKSIDAITVDGTLATAQLTCIAHDGTEWAYEFEFENGEGGWENTGHSGTPS